MEIHQSYLTETEREGYSQVTDKVVNDLFQAIRSLQPDTIYISEEKATYRVGKWWGWNKVVTDWFYGVYISKYPIKESSSVTVVCIPTGVDYEVSTVLTRGSLIAYLTGVLNTLMHLDDVIERKAKEHNFKLH